MISVLLPYRDAEATLAEAIDSVLGERAVDLEVLAIDDGSADGSRAIAESRRARDARLTIVDSGGVGVARALGIGLSAARGALIGRMDADDISLPGRFARQVQLLESDPALAAVGVQVEGFPAVGDGLAAYLAWQNAVITKADHVVAMFVESPLCHPSVLMRRAAIESVGAFVDGPFPEDYDLWLRLDRAGFGLAKVPEVLFRWRHRHERVTFRDPRCAPARILELRARYLALRLGARAFAVWGAGRTGRRLAGALEPYGLSPEFFVDIDPKKIGRIARARPIVAPSHVERSAPFLVVAVGARGARNIVRGRLATMGYEEGVDFVCAA